MSRAERRGTQTHPRHATYSHSHVVRLTGGPFDGSLRWDRTRGSREPFVISLPANHPKAKDFYAVTYSRETGRVSGWLRRPRPSSPIDLTVNRA